ncbi:MAG: dTMP kinase [Candidatus Marinimicrobia bacterium]|nr:dTMP kinase [Candidatus Neomarinimicrobiota bacterium]
MCAGRGQGGAVIRGRFIAFEGIDGSGKTTQIGLLQQQLESLGRTVTVVREPGGAGLSEEIRTLLLDHRDRDLSVRAEALLFSTARAQLVEEVLIPALERGEDVLCDRYADSTVAYQGYGRELPLDEIITIQAFATKGLRPDLKVLLDLPVERAAARLLGSFADRMESAGRAFQERIRRGYLALAEAAPAEWLVVEGDQSKESIAKEIAAHVKQQLDKDD